MTRKTTRKTTRTSVLNHMGSGSLPADEMSRLRLRSSYAMRASELLVALRHDSYRDFVDEHLRKGKSWDQMGASVRLNESTGSPHSCLWPFTSDANDLLIWKKEAITLLYFAHALIAFPNVIWRVTKPLSRNLWIPHTLNELIGVTRKKEQEIRSFQRTVLTLQCRLTEKMSSSNEPIRIKKCTI